MEEITTTVSVGELSKLITTLYQQKLPVLIRFRVLGQLWYPNFVRITELLDDRRIVFYDERRNTLVSLRNFAAIAQFEVDERINPFEPGNHYDVSGDF